MASPEFAGTTANPEYLGRVPSKRCETCTYWKRVSAMAAVGGCHNYDNMAPINNSISHVVAFTTDLGICSGWKPKE